jgi:ubiquitin-activating enzyme E1
MPKYIDFDINNQHHIDYIESTTHLIARCNSIDDTITREQIIEIAKKYNYVDNFKADENKKIASQDSELKPEVKDEINLPTNEKFKDKKMISQDFEKDDPTNWHVSWVNAASNLRAINYDIPTVTELETKGIAGRIIPAIATTTSVVSGLIIIEMIKYMLTKKKIIENKIENYRSTFVNLADTTLVYSEPMSAPQIEIANVKFNSWEKFCYTKDSTLEEFKKYYEEKFKTSISMIVYDGSIFYAGMLGIDESLPSMLSELIKDKNEGANIKYGVIITIASEDDDVNLPEIQFIIE